MTDEPTARAGDLTGASLPQIERVLRGARTTVDLAAPYLTPDVAAALVRACDAGGRQRRRLVTAGDASAVRDGFLHPDALEILDGAGFEVRSLLGLHAKVVLADGAAGILGSGNLTGAGTRGGNAELGVVLTPSQAAAALADHYEPWWDAAERLDLPWVRATFEKVRDRPRHRGPVGKGGRWRPTSLAPLRAWSERDSSGYWLKLLYGYDRETGLPVATAADWASTTEVGDSTRPSYRRGDHLVLYATEVPRHACPAVVRVISDEPVRIEAPRTDDDVQWDWVTTVEVVAAADLVDAPGLADIGVASSSVSRHGHIRLEAVQYRAALAGIRTAHDRDPGA